MSVATAFVVCEYETLLPERGVAALAGEVQLAVFRTHAGEVFALGNQDPFSGANVMSRGIVGSRGEVPTVALAAQSTLYSMVTPSCSQQVLVDMHIAAAVKVPQQIVIESPTFNKTIEPYRQPYQLGRNPMVGGRNLEYYRYDGRDIQGGTQHLLEVMRSVTPSAVVEHVCAAMAGLSER